MKAPTFMSVISRQLKENVTYEDFYQSWLPGDLQGKDPKREAVGYYRGPLQIINAVNMNDPNDILTVCLIWGTEEEIAKESERIKVMDEEREQKQMQIINHAEAQFYCVKDINLLGTTLPK